ncbi:MAG TPA: DNA polymerase III subunit chi [Lysobacter sp.]|nr:DNA polymerase III subunit chi [Lysobacter sp.]
MTSIDFYFNAEDRLQVACRLAGKALAQGKRTMIYAPDADIAQRVDRLLWTWQATGFVPHCPQHDALAAQTPVLIGAEPAAATGCDVLLNLGAATPPAFESFDRLLEVVDANEDGRRAARERYRFYRDRGYAIADHDLARMGAGAT